jgi:hypothetical protein
MFETILFQATDNQAITIWQNNEAIQQMLCCILSNILYLDEGEI